MNTIKRELSGRVACEGAATGKPVIVHSAEDLDLVKDGDILVTVETDVTFVPAMQRASAIITETGGRFCHAAIWARENKKPTLLQVVEATKHLESIERATLDSFVGKVFWEVIE